MSAAPRKIHLLFLVLENSDYSFWWLLLFSFPILIILSERSTLLSLFSRFGQSASAEWIDSGCCTETLGVLEFSVCIINL